MPSKNAPRFLDYRQQTLPLDVALSFGLPQQLIGSNVRDLVLSGCVLVNNKEERSCHRLVDRINDIISVIDIKDDIISSTIQVRDIAKPKYYICYKPRGVVCSRRRNEGIDRESSVLISDWLTKVLRAAANIANDDNSHDGPKSTNNNIKTQTAFGENNMTINTVGRLDEESEGILLLTNDGSFSRLLCDPEFGLMKTYRVVVRGSCYSKLIAGEQISLNNQSNISNGDCESMANGEEALHELLKTRVAERIKRSNDQPTVTTDVNGNETVHHFPFESCNIIDIGKLPSQHTSDDSYYVLIDLVLTEGKRHAVRRICKNAQLRVCYLSRISVEGLAGQFAVAKPQSIVEAFNNGYIVGGRHRDVVLDGKLLCRANDKDDMSVLHSGHVVELSDCEVDRIFALRKN